MRPFDPQYFVPFPDGQYFMSFLDGRKTREQIAKFSQKDVAAYDAYWGDVGPHRGAHAATAPAARPTQDQIEERFSGPQGEKTGAP